MAVNTKDFKPQTLAIDAHTCCFYSALNVQSMGRVLLISVGRTETKLSLENIFESGHPVVQGHPEHRAMLPESKTTAQ